MAKVFYTERDIEDLARQGVTSLTVTDDVVITDLAREKARRVGLQLIGERDSRPASAPARPYLSDVASPAASAPAPPAAASAPVHKPHITPVAPSGSLSSAELEARIFTAVKAKLGSQVDDALLRTIVQRVLRSLGR
ncbi:MAG: hypothetical protein KIS80_08960 [Anaerolineales bacterium]|nr:hypothetical protein [Anaerolineales bacterium]